MTDNKNNVDSGHIDQMKIVYKDPYDKIEEAIIKLPEETGGIQYSYKERVDMAISDIMDEGGFWLSSTDAIPYHRILSFHTYSKNIINTHTKRRTNKKSSNSRRKRKINDGSTSGGNSIPQTSGKSDK